MKACCDWLQCDDEIRVDTNRRLRCLVRGKLESRVDFKAHQQVDKRNKGRRWIDNRVDDCTSFIGQAGIEDCESE